MEPVRTCVVCRNRAPQVQLLRVVSLDRVLVVDADRRLPGRGCYLHRSCATKAPVRVFARGLRTALNPDQVAEVLATLSAD